MLSETTEKLRKKAVKSFMDIIILSELKDNPMSGYDVISHIHKTYGILTSSGTIYSLMYSLERDGVIKGVVNQRKRVYSLTEKGKQNIKVITKANREIQRFLKNMSLLSQS